MIWWVICAFLAGASVYSVASATVMVVFVAAARMEAKRSRRHELRWMDPYRGDYE